MVWICQNEMFTPAASETVEVLVSYDLDTLGKWRNCILFNPLSTHTLAHMSFLYWCSKTRVKPLHPVHTWGNKGIVHLLPGAQEQRTPWSKPICMPSWCATWQDTRSQCPTRRELCWLTRSRGRPRASGPSSHMVPSQTNNDQFPWHIFIDLDRQNSTFHSTPWLWLQFLCKVLIHTQENWSAYLLIFQSIELSS